KMASVARRIYDQMPDPKWVIAMGVCASSGGLYRNYAVVPGVDRILPVDVYTMGCPPRPDTLIRAIMELQKKIDEVAIDGRRRRGPPARVAAGGARRCSGAAGARAVDRRARRARRARRRAAAGDAGRPRRLSRRARRVADRGARAARRRGALLRGAARRLR